MTLVEDNRFRFAKGLVQAICSIVFGRTRKDRINSIPRLRIEMNTQRITINLPEAVFRQLVRLAEATHQPVEVLVAQSVLSNLPPSVDSASPDLQPELLRMQSLTNEALLAIAQAQVEPSQYERQTELLAKNEDSLLTPQERQALAALRQASDQLMLRKAYAWALLRWRGQRIPPLRELPLPL